MKWTKAYIDKLPDSSFAFISSGGEKDEEEKTTPRSLRHLPFKDADGTIDKTHLKNALARLSQTDITDADKKKALEKLMAAAREAGVDVEEKSVTDALSDDPVMQEIMAAATAIGLLAIKNRLAKEQLTELDRRLYYEAIDIKARQDYGAWSAESAAEEEEKDPTEANVTIVVAAIDAAKMSIITDATGESRDVCLSVAQPIMDNAGKPSGWYAQPASRVDAINDNLRLYPRPIYEPALQQLKQSGFPYPGENPHPRSYRTRSGKVQFESVLENQAVAFRDAYITDDGVVMTEYKPLTEFPKGRMVQALIDAGKPVGLSNRMTGPLVMRKVNNLNVEVPTSLSLYGWDVVMNPGESGAFTNPVPLADAAIKEICDSLKEDDNEMNFLSMTIHELKAWKIANAGHKDMAQCDEAIKLKEAAEQNQAMAEKNQAMAEELTRLQQEKANREAQEAKEQAKATAQKTLTDAVAALPYDQKTKDALIAKGSVITDAAEVPEFITREKAFVDSVVVASRLSTLGVPAAGKAVTIETGAAAEPWVPIVDNLMAAFDDNLIGRYGLRPDPELRKANRAILDRLMTKMDQENNEQYRGHMRAMTDCAQKYQDGAITDAALTASGDFAQLPMVSMAIMYQIWQDLVFNQLVMAETFGGSTYKVPVEFQSHDLLTQDDFQGVGENDPIPTEGIQTFFLEFGAFWLKRGTVISKEAQIELQKGPLDYDVTARNLASLANRYRRIIDQAQSREMLRTADEYAAVAVTNEAVAAAEIVATTGLPTGSNAAYVASLLCGYATTAIGKAVPPVVVPREKIWLDIAGRKQSALTNDITCKKGVTTLVRGTWNPITGTISAGADYAVDFERAKVYFTAASGVDATTNRPTISYSYATNLAFFDLTIPSGIDKAKYFNRLIEQIDYAKAYMGSAPRYVTPDFALGSLNAMVNPRVAELFYRWASPEGTNYLKGAMWFASRAGVQLGEVNAPWDAGDSRILLGKTNSTRMGVGSPLNIEGPYQYVANGGNTSSKQYIATQQIVLATPTVIDENGVMYNPPYRTIKFYNS